MKTTSKAAMAAAAAGAFPALTSGCSGSGDSQFDVLIKGGTVYDGTLAEPQIMDVALKDGRIAAVGQVEGKAAKTIMADGLAVCPGFIDIHTHCDLTFKRTGWKRYMAYFMSSWKGNHNYLYQGVTTVVTGNCGYGYTDLNKWMGIADAVGFGTNVYHLAPHGMIREELFGENQPTDLSSSQLEAMKRRVAEELDKGAIGFSTGLEYAPGLLSNTQELIELGKVVRQKGRLFTFHMRDESGAKLEGNKRGIFEAIKEVAEVARRAEVPVEISHLKISTPFNDVTADQVLELIAMFRDEGLDITADQYPYDAGSTFITILLPDKFKTSDSVRDEYKTKSGREEIKKAINEVFQHTPPEKTLITMYPDKEEYEGKTLKEIAELENRPAAEAYTEMACLEPAPMGVFFAQDMNVVRAFMPHEFVMTASDGWTVPKNMTKPHPRTYGCFPRKLKQFVMDEKIMPLNAAIRSMTSFPAEKFGIKDRGLIAKDMAADVVVLKLDSVAEHATYTDPHHYSTGVVHLFVNGIAAIENGKTTGDRNGRTLRM
jgi:N-acyl-D-amino-acid deacylase